MTGFRSMLRKVTLKPFARVRNVSPTSFNTDAIFRSSVTDAGKIAIARGECTAKEAEEVKQVEEVKEVKEVKEAKVKEVKEVKEGGPPGVFCKCSFQRTLSPMIV